MIPTDPYADLVNRVGALEDTLGNLSIDDLPLADLQRKMENDWQPDAAVLLQPNSITSDQIASGVLLPKARTLRISDTVTLPNLAAGAEAKIAVGTVGRDPMGWWDSVNKRWTPKLAGDYLVTYFWTSTVALASGAFIDIGVFANGAPLSPYTLTRLESAVSGVGTQGSGLMLFTLNGTTDYVELYGNCSAAGHTGVATLAATYLGGS